MQPLEFNSHGLLISRIRNFYSSRVLMSPSGWPRARALSTRRMILPERVLGRLSTIVTSSGRAIGPISWATWARSSSGSLSALWDAGSQD